MCRNHLDILRVVRALEPLLVHDIGVIDERVPHSLDSHIG